MRKRFSNLSGVLGALIPRGRASNVAQKQLLILPCLMYAGVSPPAPLCLRNLKASLTLVGSAERKQLEKVNNSMSIDWVFNLAFKEKKTLDMKKDMLLILAAHRCL